ncbi:hypothetical protein GFL88_21225 [Rhizobium leguminosarum bv. viciae]|nr:hypothetical protein [Rhizobium leguminosarum bv. viciae]
MPARASLSAPSFLCSSQESSAPKSLGAEDSPLTESFTAPTRRGWIPVTSLGQSPEDTGMREAIDGISGSGPLRLSKRPAFLLIGRRR